MFLPPPTDVPRTAFKQRRWRWGVRPRRVVVAVVAIFFALPWAAFPRGTRTTRLDGGQAGFRGVGYPSCWIRCDYRPEGEEWAFRPLSVSGLAAVAWLIGSSYLLHERMVQRVPRYRITLRGNPDAEPGAAADGRAGLS